MKKYFTLMFCLISINLFSQNLFYDAVNLGKIDTFEFEKYVNSLNEIQNSPNNPLPFVRKENLQQLDKFIRYLKNPFTNDILETTDEIYQCVNLLKIIFGSVKQLEELKQDYENQISTINKKLTNAQEDTANKKRFLSHIDSARYNLAHIARIDNSLLVEYDKQTLNLNLDTAIVNVIKYKETNFIRIDKNATKNRLVLEEFFNYIVKNPNVRIDTSKKDIFCTNNNNEFYNLDSISRDKKSIAVIYNGEGLSVCLPDSFIHKIAYKTDSEFVAINEQTTKKTKRIIDSLIRVKLQAEINSIEIEIKEYEKNKLELDTLLSKESSLINRTIQFNKDNPVLYSALSKIVAEFPNTNIISSSIQQTVDYSQKSQKVSSFSESALIDALATNMVNQFELNLLNDAFNNIIDNTELSVYIKPLFPKTYKYLKSLSPDSYYSSLSISLNRLIKDDLNNIINNALTNCKDAPNPFTKLISPEYLPIIKIIGRSADLISKGFHPAAVTSYINSNISALKNTDKQLLELVQFINITQNAFIDTSTTNRRIWLHFTRFLNLKDVRSKKIFISLLIKNLNSPELKKEINTKLTNYNFDLDTSGIFIKLENVLISLNRIDNIISKLNVESALKNSSEEIYFESIIEMNKVAIELASVFDSKADSCKYIQILESIYSLYKSIHCGDYSTVTYNFITLFDGISNNNQSTKQLAALIIKPLNLFIDIVNSKNSDDISAAIHKASSDYGTSTNKNLSSFSITLNSYLGVFVGAEHTLRTGAPHYYSGSIIAPIGIEFSFCKNRFGALLNIVDLGAITSFRFGSNDQLPANISFKQLFAYGYYFKWRPFNSSNFTLLLGTEFNPKLREVTKDNIATARENSIKYGLSLTYDIPFFSFFNNK